MASIFTKIVSGEIPSYQIAETENCLAFLDVFPIAKGHVLVIPKEEIDHYFDVDDSVLLELNNLARSVAKALKKSVECERIGISVIGLEVPHAHMHLIPIHTISDMDFTKEKLKFSKEEFESMADLIKSNLD